MTVYSEKDFMVAGGLPTRPQVVVDDDPTLGKTLLSAMAQENTVGSMIVNGYIPLTGPTRDHNGLDAIRGTEYWEHAEEFIYSGSPEQDAALMRRIDAENEQADTLARAGWEGIVASLAAGILDPIFLPALLVPGVNAVRGGRVLSGAARVAGGGMTGAAVAEAGLQATQTTRTPTESLINVSAAGLLGGVLGASGAALGKARREALTQMIDADMASDSVAFQGRNVGAAETARPTLDDLTLYGKVNGGTAFKRLNPAYWLITSPALASREALLELANHSFVLNRHLRGVADRESVEGVVDYWERQATVALRDSRRLYKAYKKNADSPMSFEEFKHEVGTAAWKGEQHVVPEVVAAAKVYRQIFRKVADELTDPEVGIYKELDQYTKDGLGYLPRMAKRDQMAARGADFRGIVKEWVRRQETRAIRASQTQGQPPRMTDVELEGIAQNVWNRYMGYGDDTGILIPDFISPKAGPLKGRTFRIPDDYISQQYGSFRDFFHSDINYVTQSYLRRVMPQVEMQRRFGDRDGTELLNRINRDYEALRKGVTDEGKLAKLNARQRRDRENVQALVKLLHGQYGNGGLDTWARVGRAIRDFNIVRLLGGMTASAIPDTGRHVAVHGMQRTGVLLAAAARDIKRLNLAKRELQEAGIALDMVGNVNRARAMANADEWVPIDDRVGRMHQKLTDKFIQATGMNLWNDLQKGTAGILAMNRIIKDSARYASINAVDRAYLAKLGIDADVAREITQQFAKHGDAGMIDLPQIHLWTENGRPTRAATVFESALRQSVDEVIVTPGAADLPLWMRTQVGGIIGQFKSFAFASMNRTVAPTIQGLQMGDWAKLNGATAMVALGGLTYIVKQLARDIGYSEEQRQRYPLDLSAANLLTNAIDYSGLLGIMPDAHNILEKVTRGQVSINRLLGAPPMSRYASRNIIGALFGPSIDMLGDFTQFTGALSTGEWSESDVRAARKMMPYQNLIYWRWLFNVGETTMADALVTER